MSPIYHRCVTQRSQDYHKFGGWCTSLAQSARRLVEIIIKVDSAEEPVVHHGTSVISLGIVVDSTSVTGLKSIVPLLLVRTS